MKNFSFLIRSTRPERGDKKKSKKENIPNHKKPPELYNPSLLSFFNGLKQNTVKIKSINRVAPTVKLIKLLLSS